MTKSIRWQFELDNLVEQVSECLEAWFAGDRCNSLCLNQFSDCVFIKSQNFVITYSNLAFQRHFSGGNVVAGNKGSSMLTESSESCSTRTDDLIVDGISKLTYEHQGRGRDGNWYTYRSTKQNLNRFADHNYAILGVTRRVRFEMGENLVNRTTDEIFQAFQSLNEDRKRLCLHFAMGKSTKEIAARLDVSKKTVDNWRREIVDAMELANSHELFVAMIRFEERGLIPGQHLGKTRQN